MLNFAKAAVALLVAVGLSACGHMGMRSDYSHNTFVAKTNTGMVTRVSFESFAAQVEFPSGETAAMLFIRQTDPATGHQLAGGPSDWDVRYAFDGETLGRVTLRGLTNAIIPSLISGGASIKIASMAEGSGTGTVIYNQTLTQTENDVNVDIGIDN